MKWKNKPKAEKPRPKNLIAVLCRIFGLVFLLKHTEIT